MHRSNRNKHLSNIMHRNNRNHISSNRSRSNHHSSNIMRNSLSNPTTHISSLISRKNPANGCYG